MPDLSGTHIEAPAREACGTLASVTQPNDATTSDAPAKEAAAGEALTREAPASRVCHFLRIPPGELSNLLFLSDDPISNHGLQKFAYKYIPISSNPLVV